MSPVTPIKSPLPSFQTWTHVHTQNKLIEEAARRKDPTTPQQMCMIIISQALLQGYLWSFVCRTVDTGKRILPKHFKDYWIQELSWNCYLETWSNTKTPLLELGVYVDQIINK